TPAVAAPAYIDASDNQLAGAGLDGGRSQRKTHRAADQRMFGNDLRGNDDAPEERSMACTIRRVGCGSLGFAELFRPSLFPFSSVLFFVLRCISASLATLRECFPKLGYYGSRIQASLSRNFPFVEISFLCPLLPGVYRAVALESSALSFYCRLSTP